MEVRRIGGTLVLRGVLDARCTATLRDLVNDHVARCEQRIVLDFAGVDLVDRHVLRLLVAAAHRATHEGKAVVILDGSPALRRALCHPGLRRLFSLERSSTEFAVTA